MLQIGTGSKSGSAPGMSPIAPTNPLGSPMVASPDMSARFKPVDPAALAS